MNPARLMDGTWPEIAVSCLTILVSGYLLAEVLVYGAGVTWIALFIGVSTVFLPLRQRPVLRWRCPRPACRSLRRKRPVRWPAVPMPSWPRALPPTPIAPSALPLSTRSTSAAPPIAYIRKVISPERMLYAMDYPWQFVPEEVGALDAMGIGEEGLKQFFEGNARRLFKI
jgi:hypothetical protein